MIQRYEAESGYSQSELSVCVIQIQSGKSKRKVYRNQIHLVKILSIIPEGFRPHRVPVWPTVFEQNLILRLLHPLVPGAVRRIAYQQISLLAFLYDFHIVAIEIPASRRRSRSFGHCR